MSRTLDEILEMFVLILAYIRRDEIRSLQGRGSLRLILLKSVHFGTFTEVLTGCGYSL